VLVAEEKPKVELKRSEEDFADLKRSIEGLATQLHGYIKDNKLDEADVVIDRIKKLRGRLGTVDIGNLQYELVSLEADVKLARLS